MLQPHAICEFQPTFRKIDLRFVHLNQLVSCAHLLASLVNVSSVVRESASLVNTCQQMLEQIRALRLRYFLFQQIQAATVPPSRWPGSSNSHTNLRVCSTSD